MKKKPTRGGKRKGAGRPSIDPADKARLVATRLYPAELTRLRKHGATDSEALRAVLTRSGIVQRNEAGAPI